ncbi:hypothetical protein ACFWUZ_31900 [Streptomyces sp. NPDC058646]|uniref:hypothetical protein n=1 Tax=Streptomyces sp. NPDC058646 TaxID=3346574 RepID=UPI003668C4EA
MTVPAALAGTVYEAAVGRSGGHCECDLQQPGNCGLGPAKFHSSGQRCYEREAYRSPLVVAPRDPEVSDRDAIGLPASEVMVLCRGCFVRRRNKADKERAARNKEALLSDENTLFPSDLLGPTGLTHLEQQRDAA